MDTLEEFCNASGLKVNTMKSKAMCSKMVQGTRKCELKNASSIKFVANLGNYLGFPLVKGRVSRDVYNDVLDKVHKKLASWKGNLLNKAGRACLVKSVTTAIPVYTMQLHYLPSFMCNRLDQLSRSFLWGGDGLSRTWNHVNWETVTTPKRYGGLGIRDSRITNISLLGKLLWSMLHDKNKLWVQVLTHKYVGHNSIWVAKKNSRPSITWRGIMKAIESFEEGYYYRVGVGDTSFWYQDWTKLGPLCQLVPYVHISDTQIHLRDVLDIGTWNLSGLYTMLPPELTATISLAQAPTSLDDRLQDTWAWKHCLKGTYSCSSGYHWLLQQHRNWDPNCDTRWIWRHKVPAKLQHFTWLCYHNALPTNARRHICNMAASPSCARCSSPMEDLLHLLRDCPHSKELWLRLGFGNQTDFFSATEAQIWVQTMTCGTTSILFTTTLWFIWCWRNNMIFETHPWHINEVTRKIYLLHDECLTYYPTNTIHPATARLLARWSPPPDGKIKVNVDGSFLDSDSRLGSGGVVRGPDSNWITGFTHYEDGGDALLAELRAILLGLKLCHDLGYRDFVCECDCLDAVSLVNSRDNHSFHCHASTLLLIRETLDLCGNAQVIHILRDQNKVADFMAKKSSHTSSSCIWCHPPPGLESLLLLDKLSS